VAAERALSAEAARRFFVRRHLLAPSRSLPASHDGVLEVFRRLGSVQFDPLSVAGRNHDLVLHARVAGYDRAWTDELLYERRELFEAINKGLSLLPASELPWYRVSWDLNAAAHEAGLFVRERETVEHVLERIRAEGPQSSLDFERRAAIDWFWGPTNAIRAALEALGDAGVLALARREGNRRYYDLVERLFPEELLARRVPPREQFRHKLLSRHRAHGLLGTAGSGEVWLGTGRARPDPKRPGRPTRTELREELVAAGELVPLAVEGLRATRYVLRDELPLLEEAPAAGAPSASFLAPLDPFMWDRAFVRDLFGFDYVWEVYVPEAKRRWGYYVLPILFGDRLVGRIEPRIDRTGGSVRVLGAWWEDGFKPRRAEGFVDAMREALADYLRFAGARRLEWATRLPGERRLFGVRPVSRR
jgi:uncharacterized protein YcaQ